jgi:hypothetical protein
MHIPPKNNRTFPRTRESTDEITERCLGKSSDVLLYSVGTQPDTPNLAGSFFVAVLGCANSVPLESPEWIRLRTLPYRLNRRIEV